MFFGRKHRAAPTGRRVRIQFHSELDESAGTTMVIYRGPDGKPGYAQFEAATEVHAFVESLYLADEAAKVRVFQLSERSFDVHPR